ncbi:MAG: dihydrolipoamide acetyltransferase family protein, partial [Dehalococcoidia bacterium]
GIAEAEIVRWLVEEGQRVELDQPIVEIQTDKAVVEVPAPVAGRITHRGAREGDMLQVGELLVVLQEGNETGKQPVSVGAGIKPSEEGKPNGNKPGDAASPMVAPPAAAPPSRPLATPAVRKLARELNIDLATVAGSGAGGRISVDDVQAFVEPATNVRSGEASKQPTSAIAQSEGRPTLGTPDASEDQTRLRILDDSRTERITSRGSVPTPQASGLAEERVPLRGLRRRIAEAMTLSWRTIPHITGQDEVDVTALVALREQLKPVAEAAGVRLTYLPFIVKAAIAALKRYPIVNAYLDEPAGEIVYRRHYNIGIATATPDGLIVPVVHDADRKSLRELQTDIVELSEQARTRHVALAALQGGTFTITNFGSLGGWLGTPIIRPGEAGVLGIGRIQDRPWAVKGALEVRQVMGLSFSADHRLIDGDVSTAFMQTVASYLADPMGLFLEMA